MYLPDRYEFFCPVKTSSGNKALEHLPFELDTLGSKSPFLITSKDVSNKGLVKKVINAFKDSGLSICIYDGTPKDPGFNDIKRLGELFNQSGCDAIIALGSKTLVDTAKVLNIFVSGDSNGDLNPDQISEDNCANTPFKPLIFLPTSPGNGYETTKYAFLEKKVFSSHFLMPNLVVMDPRMITNQDVQSIVSGAMVALTQSVEAFTGSLKNPITDSYSHASIKTIMGNILSVLAKVGHKPGRLALVNAETMAGCAFSNSDPGMAHILGKESGKYCDLPPGILMGILLPYVLEHKMTENGDHTADLLLPLGGLDLFSVSEESIRAKKAISILYELSFNIYDLTKGKVPYTLKDCGITKKNLMDIAESTADQDGECMDIDGCLKVLEHAWDGTPMVK